MIEYLAEYMDYAIGTAEEDAACSAIGLRPLSGFLGGELRGGYAVQKLEDEWAARFGVKHAIACNSATSGLFAAAHAIGLGPGDRFLVSPFTMSATAAAPAMTGAMPMFGDVDSHTFNLHPAQAIFDIKTKAVFLTHLFGLATYEAEWKRWCDAHDQKLVVDAAQAPLAVVDKHVAGTTAHLGVYSLNVHKHIQCGEGGIVVTADDESAERVRYFINHGEMAGGRLGLNLRMTEVTAAIARIQLRRADELIAGRAAQARAIVEAIGRVPGILPPLDAHPHTQNVYYTIPFTTTHDRGELVAALRAEGVPLVEGYVAPLYRLPAFEEYGWPCPVAEDLHDHSLFYFENCRYSPTPEQIRQIGDAFKRVAEHADRRTQDRA